MTLWKALLSTMISRHGKRILFVTSLYCQLTRADRMREDAIGKLNAIMRLAHSEEALRLPIAMRGMVWNGTHVGDEIAPEMLDRDMPEDVAKEVSRKVVAATPKWVRYGRAEDMEGDVVTLLQHTKELAIH